MMRTLNFYGSYNAAYHAVSAAARPVVLACSLLCLAGGTAMAQSGVAPASASDAAGQASPARQNPLAQHAMMLSSALAGTRLVTVGANGYVLLSDDAGKSYRQAAQVPVDFTLTGVSFCDARQGWAVGHGGTVIHSSDGGEHWSMQRRDNQVDQPLYSLYFRDAQHGWAVGLWSLLIQTNDGGASWSNIKLPMAEGQKRADLNLLNVFADSGTALYIAAEQGTLYRSVDNGVHWEVKKTGSNGSLWAGVVTAAHTLIVGGLGGKLFRSSDNGDNWQAVVLPNNGAGPVTGSITGLKRIGDQIVAATLDGNLLQSNDDGRSWQIAATAPVPLTGVVVTHNATLLGLSKQGPVALLTPVETGR